MKLTRKNLQGRPVAGTDGEVGKVVDLFFDDERWTVRYLVVETGGWFSSRQVLVSPASLSEPPGAEGPLRADMTRRQIEKSPPVDTHQPVSRQYEAEHAAYFGTPMYWAGGGLWGPGGLPWSPQASPPAPEPDHGQKVREARQQAGADAHLRSCNEVAGYHIRAVDGDIGHLEDFLVDPESMRIAQLVIDTRNWLPGKHVRIDPDLIREVDWHQRKVHVELTRARIEALPDDAP